MQLSTVRKYRKRYKLFDTLLAKNPVLVQGLDLPFVIAAAFTLKNAVGISIMIFIIHIGTMLAAMLTVRYLPRRVRPVINVAVSTLLMLIGRAWVSQLFPNIINSVGMYVYLTSVNGMTIYSSNAVSKNAKLGSVFSTACLSALAFSMIMVLVSLVREYFGNGTLWGLSIPSPVALSGISMRFFGFIFVGFMLAAAKYFNKKLLAFRVLDAARKDAAYTEISTADE